MVWRWAKYLIPYVVMIVGLAVVYWRKREAEYEREGFGLCLILGAATLVYLFSSAATHYYFFFATFLPPSLMSSALALSFTKALVRASRVSFRVSPRNARVFSGGQLLLAQLRAK